MQTKKVLVVGMLAIALLLGAGASQASAQTDSQMAAQASLSAYGDIQNVFNVLSMDGNLDTGTGDVLDACMQSTILQAYCIYGAWTELFDITGSYDNTFYTSPQFSNPPTGSTYRQCMHVGAYAAYYAQLAVIDLFLRVATSSADVQGLVAIIALYTDLGNAINSSYNAYLNAD